MSEHSELQHQVASLNFKTHCGTPVFEQALTGEGLQKSNKPLTSFLYKEAGNAPYSRLRPGEAESPCRSQAALGGGALTALSAPRALPKACSNPHTHKIHFFQLISNLERQQSLTTQLPKPPH